jgi:hypothetical protein
MDQHKELDLDEALLLLNDWLGQSVRLQVLIRLGAPDQFPPSGPATGWHVLLGREAQLRRPDLSTARGAEADMARQLTVGTYELGDGPLKLLLGDLPCERLLALGEEGQPPHRLAFYLPGSAVVLLLEQLRATN